LKNKIKIIADSKIPFLQGVLEPFAEISYIDPALITNEVVNDADALIIRTRTKCDAKLLENSSVKFIATTTIGFDHIDTTFCDVNGIKWINAPGCNSNSVMQYVASALLTLANQKKFQLNELTIGIVGVGNVGSKIEKLSKIFGMKVLLNDPPRERKEGSGKFVPLDYLIAHSDIITLHVPLNISGLNKTFHLFDHNLIEIFNTDKILINTSRGEVISTDALKNAIKNKKITNCILDVWENEPQIDQELLNMVDIATPHIAGYSIEGKANGTAVCVNAVNSFFYLGLEHNWYPKNLPAANNPLLIEFDSKEKSLYKIIYDCINATYNILDDDYKLRSSTNEFESQRENYPVRREFNYYKVKSSTGSESLRAAIYELGFNLV